MSNTELTPDEAHDILKQGGRIRMAVGTDPEDPVISVSVEDGVVIGESIGGWSAGVTEPVCDLGDTFVETYYFKDRHSLTEETS